MHHRLTEKQWEETFKPHTNPFDEDAPWCGWSFSSFDEDEEDYVDRAYNDNPNRVWSITDEDGRLQIVPGYFSHGEGYIGLFVVFIRWTSGLLKQAPGHWHRGTMAYPGC